MLKIASPLLFLPLLPILGACSEKKEAPPPPVPEVKVAQVVKRDVPVHVEAIGETRGNTEIEIRARVEGFIQTVDYKEGSLVKKGQLLYTIDSRPFEANFAKAKAGQAEAEAQLARTHQDVVRYEPLVKKHAISQQDYDTAVALEKAASAVVDAAKAVLEQAQIDLSYTKVMAPEDGLAGRTEVYAGTLVGRGSSTLLTRISRIDPIHVRFSFPERDYLAYARKRGTGAGANAGTGNDSGTPFELMMADGTTLPSPGKLVFVDRNVDSQTGTIMAEAAFANPGDLLRPGQYARVRATIEQRIGALLVPQRAVKETQGVFSVMVVGQGDEIEERIVTTAERIGPLWVIETGLKGGERVVVEGLQKVRPKMKVHAQEMPAEEKESPPSAAAPTTKPGEPK